jgi:hypothetical protein
MTEFAFQQALVRLLTDAKFRHAFFAGNLGPVTEAGLSSEDAQRLLGIDPERLEVFAEMVMGQRINDAAQGLFLTSQLLGDRFSQIGVEFNSEVRPGYSKREHNALAFGRYLKKRFGLEPPIPTFVEDVLTYEMATLELFRRYDEPDLAQTNMFMRELMQHPEDLDLERAVAPYQLSSTRVLFLNHDIAPIVEEMKLGRTPTSPSPQAVRILLRVSPFGITEQSTINSATAAFIEACDGKASLYEIMGRVASDFQQSPTAEFREKCLSLCASLVERRIVDFKELDARAIPIN